MLYPASLRFSGRVINVSCRTTMSIFIVLTECISEAFLFLALFIFHCRILIIFYFCSLCCVDLLDFDVDPVLIEVIGILVLLWDLSWVG